MFVYTTQQIETAANVLTEEAHYGVVLLLQQYGLVFVNMRNSEF
jgi:hypothetical protein